MKPLISFLLVSHVVAGTVALLLGLVPMFSRKGSPLHNRTGLGYVAAMTYVALTSALLCLFQPFTLFRLFLAGIAIFSFYLSTTGWRATRQKKGEILLFDRALTYGTLLVSAGMIGAGIWLFTEGASFLSVLFAFFGVLTAGFTLRDARQFGRPAEKMAWSFRHIARMGGSYIAAFTAFLVNNNARLLPADMPDWVFLAGWVAPTVVGGALIGHTIRHYKTRFPKKTAVAQ